MQNNVSPHMDRIASLSRYLAQDPNNLDLLAELTDAHIESRAYDEARKLIDNALRLKPQSPHLMYRSAVVDRLSGHYDRALTVLLALNQQGETSPVVLGELAEAQYALTDYVAAEQTLEQVIVQTGFQVAAPRSDLLYVRCLHRAGKMTEAIAFAVAHMATSSAPRLLREALATVYYDNDQLDKAHELYLQAEASGDMGAELRTVGGYVALANHHTKEAAATFAAAIAEQPDNGRALLGAGLTAAAARDLPQATAYLQRTVEAMPSHLGSWVTLAWMQLLQGKPDNAEDTLNRSLEVDRTFGETYGALASVAAVKGQTEKARELMKTALRLNKQSFGVMFADMVIKSGGKIKLEQVQASLQKLASYQVKTGTRTTNIKDSVMQAIESSGEQI